MSNRRTTVEKIEEAKAKITQYENHMKKLQQQQKSEGRKARTKRLCSRHGLLEKFMPDLIDISDEQFELFIKKGIDTQYGRSRLAEIVNGKATPPPQGEEKAARYVPAPTAKNTETVQVGGTSEGAQSSGVGIFHA